MQQKKRITLLATKLKQTKQKCFSKCTEVNNMQEKKRITHLATKLKKPTKSYFSKWTKNDIALARDKITIFISMMRHGMTIRIF